MHIYYVYFSSPTYDIAPGISILTFPLLVILMALLGLGSGMMVSSMTTKYRDLTFLIQFGVQLLMYGSAVMYPMSYFKDKLPNYYWLIEWNPIAIIVESFRAIILGNGELDINKLIYAIIISCLIFLRNS